MMYSQNKCSTKRYSYNFNDVLHVRNGVPINFSVIARPIGVYTHLFQVVVCL